MAVIKINIIFALSIYLFIQTFFFMQELLIKAKKNLPSNKTIVKKEKKGLKHKWFKILLNQEILIDKDGFEVIQPAMCAATDFSKAEYLIRNRMIEINHAVKLSRSITNTGMLLRYPIIVLCKGKYYIVDGQHLLKSIKMLDGERNSMNVRFSYFENDNLDTVMDIVNWLNSTSKRWSVKQHVRNLAAKNKDYQILQNYYEKYGIQYRVMAGIFMQENGGNTETIRNGNFKITSPIKIADKKLQAINNIYVKTSIKKCIECALGLTEFMNSVGLDRYYSHEVKFINKLNKALPESDLKERNYGNAKDYVRFFNDVWTGK